MVPIIKKMAKIDLCLSIFSVRNLFTMALANPVPEKKGLDRVGQEGPSRNALTFGRPLAKLALRAGGKLWLV